MWLLVLRQRSATHRCVMESCLRVASQIFNDFRNPGLPSMGGVPRAHHEASAVKVLRGGGNFSGREAGAEATRKINAVEER